MDGRMDGWMDGWMGTLEQCLLQQMQDVGTGMRQANAKLGTDPEPVFPLCDDSCKVSCSQRLRQPIGKQRVSKPKLVPRSKVGVSRT